VFIIHKAASWVNVGGAVTSTLFSLSFCVLSPQFTKCTSRCILFLEFFLAKASFNPDTSRVFRRGFRNICIMMKNCERIKVGLPIKSASMFEKLPHTSRVQLLPDRCTCRMFAFPPSAGTGTVFEEQIETNRSGRGSHPGEDAPESGSVVRGATSEQVSPGERLRGI
jgi:hypothetical protein